MKNNNIVEIEGFVRRWSPALELKDHLLNNSISNALIATDNHFVNYYLKELLKWCGVCVSTASCAEAALLSLYSGKYDFLVADNDLPDMDSASLCSAVNEIRPHLPVILIHAQGMRPNYSHDGAAFIEKPFVLEEIVYAVKDALERKRNLAHYDLSNNEEALAQCASMR